MPCHIFVYSFGQKKTILFTDLHNWKVNYLFYPGIDLSRLKYSKGRDHAPSHPSPGVKRPLSADSNSAGHRELPQRHTIDGHFDLGAIATGFGKLIVAAGPSCNFNHVHHTHRRRDALVMEVSERILWTASLLFY